VDNQRIAILALIVSICLCSLCLLYLKSRPKSSKEDPASILAGREAVTRKQPDVTPAHPSGSSGNSGSSGISAVKSGTVEHSVPPTAGISPVSGKTPVAGPPPLEMTSPQPDIPLVKMTPDTMAQLEEKASQIRSHRQKVAEASENWLREKLDDENLADKTKEVYRLRLLPGMKEGIALLEANDYAGALRSFEKALEDPDATPVSKHLIYDYMLQAAGKMKDKMLYASMFKAQAVLQRDQDLSVLGLDKSSQSVEYAEYMTDHLKAANDEATFNKIVERDMKNIGASSADREKVAADVKERIREFEGFFDDRKS